MPNVELLQKTMQYIKDHPQKHDQRIWTNSCGTAHCFAGWTARLSDWSVTDIDWKLYYRSGADLLGIEFEEAKILFNIGNTIPMLELIVKDLVNGDTLRDLKDYRDEDKDVVLRV